MPSYDASKYAPIEEIPIGPMDDTWSERFAVVGHDRMPAGIDVMASTRRHTPRASISSRDTVRVLLIQPSFFRRVRSSPASSHEVCRSFAYSTNVLCSPAIASRSSARRFSAWA
jgi:hypothetical protein